MCCEKQKIVSIMGKCSDTFNLECIEEGVDYNGYVPKDIGMGCDDEIYFDYCLNCGKIQGDFPKELTPQIYRREG